MYITVNHDGVSGAQAACRVASSQVVAHSLVALVVPHPLRFQLHRQDMPTLLPVPPGMTFARLIPPTAYHAAHHADPIVLGRVAHRALGESEYLFSPFSPFSRPRLSKSARALSLSLPLSLRLQLSLALGIRYLPSGSG